MLPALLIFLAASTRPVVVAPLPLANLTTSLLLPPPPPVWVDDAEENLTTTAETVLDVQLDPGGEGLMEEEEIGVAAGGGFFKHTTGFARDVVRPKGKQEGSFLQPLVDFIRSLFPPIVGAEQQHQPLGLTRLL
jgi:hypothetical protein